MTPRSKTADFIIPGTSQVVHATLDLINQRVTVKDADNRDLRLEDAPAAYLRAVATTMDAIADWVEAELAPAPAPTPAP